MDDKEKYLTDLKSADKKIRRNATQALWKIWYQEAGEKAETMLNHGTDLMNHQKLKEAETIFYELLREYPDFAEAHNKLATLLYMKGSFSKSVTECKATLKINPIHFGAWNGMGLCLFNLGNYPEAIRCFERALQIQPHAMINRIYIARCRGNLN